MALIINLVVSAIAVLISAYILPGVSVSGFMSALVVAVVLGIINAVIKPIISIFALPITVLTLGLFSIIINGLMILLVDAIVPGFQVDGILWAIIFGFVLSLVNGFFGMLSN